jgi:hypothetical protein
MVGSHNLNMLSAPYGLTTLSIERKQSGLPTRLPMAGKPYPSQSLWPYKKSGSQMCGVQPRIRNVDSQFGQPRNCDKVVTIILCGSGSYHNFLARNDVLACCVLGRGRRGLAFCIADRIGRHNGSHTRLFFWRLKRCQRALELTGRISDGKNSSSRSGFAFRHRVNPCCFTRERAGAIT